MPVDIKKLGRIPDGGGDRAVGRQAGHRHRTRTPGKTLDARGRSHVGYSYPHNAVDDHSRLAYSEILPDERTETAAAFWQRAQLFFTTHGITVQTVLGDNGACYTSRLWRDTLTNAGIIHTHPPLPRKRESRTLQPHPARRMGLQQPYPSERARRDTLPGWLHTHNHHRGHTALGGHPPASRVPNLPRQNTYGGGVCPPRGRLRAGSASGG